jgi:hypothetical protein
MYEVEGGADRHLTKTPYVQPSTDTQRSRDRDREA